VNSTLIASGQAPTAPWAAPRLGPQNTVPSASEC
jgi:hypothetical protein